METTYADSWSDMAQPYDTDSWVMKWRSACMTYISRTSGFVFYLDDYLMYVHHTLGSMNQYDSTFGLKINVGHCDLYSMVKWFCLISWRLFDVWTLLFRIMSQYGPKFDLKINIGHYDLYFMVHWFCLISWRLFDVCTSYFGSMNQNDPIFDLWHYY